MTWGDQGNLGNQEFGDQDDLGDQDVWNCMLIKNRASINLKSPPWWPKK